VRQRSEGGNELADVEVDRLLGREIGGLGKSCRGFLPILLACEAVTDEQVAESAASSDVVGVVLIVDMLKAGHACGRVAELKVSVMKGLSEGERRQGQEDQEEEGGPEAQEDPL